MVHTLVHTSLYQEHLALHAKMVDFHGWTMPMEYTSIMAEHRCVRESVGIFDLSHMGELLVTGSDGVTAMNALVANDISVLAPGQIQYNFLLTKSGGIIDDILVYRIPEGLYLVVNASNTTKDYQWIIEHTSGDIQIRNITLATALIAIQGPNSLAVLEKTLQQPFSHLAYYGFCDVDWGGVQIRVSRTGYTGEDGFELYLAHVDAPALWVELLVNGAEFAIAPIGLGARDTLRLEMGMPLYGNEITEETTPLEAGLERFVKFSKANFFGKKSLLAQKQQGIKRRLVGLELQGRGIPRAGYPITDGETVIGQVSSGSISPMKGKGIALGYVQTAYAVSGSQVYIKIRSDFVAAKVIKGRIVQNNKRR